MHQTLPTASEELAMECVEEGAAFLDAKCPGWADRIDLDRLNVGSIERCVLGQLYGSYYIAKDTMDTPYGDESYGFDCGEVDEHYVTFDQLTSAWAELITNRRLAAAGL